MPASLWFYVAMAGIASVGAMRLLHDAFLRRRLASVTPSLSENDQAWVDALARGIDNDREIIAGYLRDVLDLRERDAGEATRRLTFAQEQVQQAALPDALDALESLRGVASDLPAVAHLRAWPGTPLQLRWCQALSIAASIAATLALTSRGRARIRLWLIQRVVRHAAQRFIRNAAVPVDGTFVQRRHPRLQAAASDLRSGQAALVALAEQLLLARAAWALLSSRES